MSDHKTLVTKYLDAVGDGRLDELADYLAPDVSFDGAGARPLQGADAYVAALERLRPVIARNEIRTIVVEGNRAAVLYDFVTDTPVGPVTSAEWLTVDAEGRITSVYLLFDKARWPEVLAHLEAVAAAA